MSARNNILTFSSAEKMLEDSLREVLEKFDQSEMMTEKRQAVRRWLIKKADIHPRLVCQAMTCQIATKEINDLIAQKGVSAEKLRITALLHDLGRMREVDLQKDEIVLFQTKYPYTHSYVSYQMLLEKGVTDPEILLPVRYHNQGNFETGLGADQLFKDLSASEQERIRLMWFLIMDADTLGNMAYQSQHGLKGTFEELSSQYTHDALISPKIKDVVMQRKAQIKDLKSLEKTFADVLVRSVVMVSFLHFEASRRLFSTQYLSQLYGHLCAEIENASGTLEERRKALDDAREIYNFLK